MSSSVVVFLQLLPVVIASAVFVSTLRLGTRAVPGRSQPPAAGPRLTPIDTDQKSM